MKRTPHDEGLDRVLNELDNMDIPYPRLVAREAKLFDRDGRVITDIDIYVAVPHARYLIEYKSSDRRRKAVAQLTKQEEFVRALGIDDVRKYYICRDKVEKLN